MDLQHTNLKKWQEYCNLIKTNFCAIKNFYKISIPKPCKEKWEDMNPTSTGRFCHACTKQVIDFTMMNTVQIQEYLHLHQDERVCGRFYKKQLDTIHIQIPETVLYQKRTFNHSFLLALLIAMGTTILSCTTTTNQSQKIESIDVITTQTDKGKQNLVLDTTNKISNSIIDQDIFIGTILNKKDSIEITTIEGIVDWSPETESGTPVDYRLLHAFPSFKELEASERTSKNFSNQIKRFITDNFNTDISKELPISGIQKIYTRFDIDKEGDIENIKVRAPHPKLEQEALRVIQKIPRLVPAIYKNKKVTTTFGLPIIFKIDTSSINSRCTNED